MNSGRLTSGMIPRLRFAASVTIGQDAADAADRALGWLSHFNMKRCKGTSGTHVWDLPTFARCWLSAS